MFRAAGDYVQEKLLKSSGRRVVEVAEGEEAFYIWHAPKEKVTLYAPPMVEVGFERVHQHLGEMIIDSRVPEVYFDKQKGYQTQPNASNTEKT